MRMSSVVVAVAVAGGPAAAESSVYSHAAPPDRADLARLNLKDEWNAYIPLNNRQDALGPVQVIDQHQIFVQTRAGLLVALDARTGATQWKFQLPAGYVQQFPVGVNNQFVMVCNLANVLCFQRYTGLLEFNLPLTAAPIAGPVLDADQFYLCLTGGRVAAHKFITPVKFVDPKQTGKGNDRDRLITGADRKAANPSDQIADRYGRRSVNPADDARFDPTNLPASYFTAGIDALDTTRSPSISALPYVTPPYTLAGRALADTPSISILPSVRRPYKLVPDYLQYNQRSPSVSAIPPSVARAYELSNLRAKPVEPPLVWVYGTRQRVSGEPVAVAAFTANTAPRLWVTVEGKALAALSKIDRSPQVTGTLTDRPAGPMAGPVARPDGVYGYLPQADGQLLAIDLTGGTTVGPRVAWRANVGGPLDRKPVVTADAIYAAGTNSGVARIDAATGDVTWRTESTADRLLGASNEYVYVADHRGRLLVYAAKGKPGTATPLTGLDVAGFNVPVTNAVTDRLLLASDNGLIVCLRDAGAKYAAPVMIAPAARPAGPPVPVTVDPTKPIDPGVAPAAPAPPPAVPPLAPTAPPPAAPAPKKN